MPQPGDLDFKAIRAGLQRTAAQPFDVDRDEPRPAPRRWRKIATIAGLSILLLPLLTISGFRLASVLRETRTAAELAPPTGRFVTTSQGRIFIQEKGDATAPPVILIHGTAAWSELWREMIDHLAGAGFRVIAIDLPPFGFSDRPANRDYTRAAQSARIAALIEALSLKNVTLVGHSFGAGPTVETIMRYPANIRGLVLIAGALGVTEASGSPPALVDWVLRTDTIRNPLVATLVTNPMMTRTLLSSMVYRKDAADARRAAILQRPMTLRGTTPDLGPWLVYFTGRDEQAWSMDRARYATIKVKTQLLWGDKDTLTPLPQGRDINSLIAGSELTVIPDIGHIPQIEDPAHFAPLLAEAVRKVSQR